MTTLDYVGIAVCTSLGIGFLLGGLDLAIRIIRGDGLPKEVSDEQHDGNDEAGDTGG